MIPINPHAAVALAILIAFLSLIIVPKILASPKDPTILAEPLDVERMIWALKLAENWDGHSIGKRGERGPLQFTASRWHELTVLHFSCAMHGGNVYDVIAARHVLDLIAQCEQIGAHPTAYMIGALHNAGRAAVVSGRFPKAKKDFAQRVQNLYDDKS